jgi:ribose/xylose/arabinose/galactoside ABC-type transport system permease subunit
MSTEVGDRPEAAAGDAAQSTSGRAQRLLITQELILFAVLIALVVYFSIAATGFDNGDNIKTIGIYLSVLGVLSIGQTLVIIGGGFDLSNGANLAFSSAVGATMLSHGDNQILAIVVVLVLATAIGLANGFFVAVCNINSFITTLATYLIFSGAAYVYTNSNTVSFSLNLWQAFGRGDVSIIPVPIIIFVVIAIIGGLTLRFTVFGRSLYAMGGNAPAARLAGISLRKNLLVVFALSGLSAGIGALIQSSLTSAGSASFAGQLNLQSITAVILGGAALTGGEGGVAGTVLGVVLTQTILDGMTLLNVSSFYQNIVTGIVLLCASILAAWRHSFKGLGFLRQIR